MRGCIVNVTVDIQIYQIDGEDTPPIERPTLILKSHWSKKGLVHLLVGGQDYLVDAAEVYRGLDAIRQAHAS